MKIFDQNMNPIENPDIEAGIVEYIKRKVFHRYIVTVEEEGHFKTTAEYPNGGKDVEWVIDRPEEGKWITLDEAGNEIKCEGIIPNNLPKDVDTENVEEIGIYRPYTDEELAEIERMKELADQPTTEEILDVLLGMKTGGETDE